MQSFNLENNGSASGAKGWFKRKCKDFAKYSLVAFVICFETSGSLLASHVMKRDRLGSDDSIKPLPTSMTATNAVISLCISLLIVAGHNVHSKKTIRAIPEAFCIVFNWRTILYYSLVATTFTIQCVFSYLAYSRVDAGLKKVMDQLRLPTVAALSTAIVNKRYNMQEWFALVILFFAVVTFYLTNLEHDGVTDARTKCRYPASCFEKPPFDLCAVRVDGTTILGSRINNNTGNNWHDISFSPIQTRETDRIGLVFCLIVVALNSVGSLLLEKFLKKDGKIPFPYQKAQMEITGVPVAIAMAFIVPLVIDTKGGSAIWWTKTDAAGSGRGFFQGFSRLTFAVAAVNVTQTWLTGLVIKRFSAVISKLSACLTLVLTVLLSGTTFKPCAADMLPTSMFALSCIIALAIVVFGNAGQQASPVESGNAQESSTSDLKTNGETIGNDARKQLLR
jgi:hypothetical protein